MSAIAKPWTMIQVASDSGIAGFRRPTQLRRLDTRFADRRSKAARRPADFADLVDGKVGNAMSGE